MEDNYTKELEQDDIDLIAEFKAKDKLHSNFLLFTTYDMVQGGYPIPNHGKMIARGWGGTDGEGKLLPSNGKWCKVEDVIKLLTELGIYLLI